MKASAKYLTAVGPTNPPGILDQSGISVGFMSASGTGILSEPVSGGTGEGAPIVPDTTGPLSLFSTAVAGLMLLGHSNLAKHDG